MISYIRAAYMSGGHTVECVPIEHGIKWHMLPEKIEADATALANFLGQHVPSATVDRLAEIISERGYIRCQDKRQIECE